MADTTTTRNRLLAALVALLALACVLLAMLLLQPASKAPTAAAPSPTSSVITPTPAQGQQAQPQQSPTARQVQLDAKGYGQLGDLARRTPNDPMALGRVDAPVVLVEWADYACPFCAVWAQNHQKQLIQKYVDAGVLRIEWRDLVIFGEKSQRAAQAGRAAAAQGRYWQFHDALFAASPTNGHPDLTDELLLTFAQKAGVPDLDRFRKDMDSPAVAQAVKADTAQANGFGASSTPVFSINGVPVVGAQDIGQFTQVIDAAAQVQAKLKG